MLCRNLPGEAEENHDNLKQNNWCPRLNSNPKPSEYNSQALLLHAACSVIHYVITYIVHCRYCGVAPKGRSIERPLLINGYASSSGFIGNDCKPTQRQLRNIGNMSEVHFLGNEYTRPLPRKSLYE
jgi:hypothetical protein